MSEHSWDYRVIEFVDPSGEAYRAIHEVYYKNDTPSLYSENAAIVQWDVGEDPAQTLGMMEQALYQPVLKEADFPPLREVRPLPSAVAP